LRVLALCILEHDDLHTGLLCFEEPENGIHPARIATMATLLKDLSTDFSDETLPLRQVIVNTHSTKLVQKVYKWRNDPNVSIWFSQISNIITTSVIGRIKLSITKILPVQKENEYPLLFPCTDAEMKMTLTKVNEYLDTTENL
jgi:predicted ATP-dependent endonuclease of OLD family